MNWPNRFLMFLAVVYLSTGVYVVRGNEQALVRWFGRARPALSSSGLHFALPWPFCQIDRLNVRESRVITIGLGTADEVDDSDFLKPLASSRQSEYLTGDKNILNLQIGIQFRVDDPAKFLLSHESPERHLRGISQRLAVAAISQCGVDYVHPLGLNALRQELTVQVRQATEQLEMGVFVEDVTLADVRPPTPVKQAFLEVSNARAERDRAISESQALAERQLARASAEASRMRSEAEAARAEMIAQASSAANRFEALVQQMKLNSEEHGTAAVDVKRMTQQRLYLTTLETLWPRLVRNVILDDSRTVDLTIQRRSSSPPSKD